MMDGSWAIATGRLGQGTRWPDPLSGRTGDVPPHFVGLEKDRPIVAHMKIDRFTGLFSSDVIRRRHEWTFYDSPKIGGRPKP